MILDRRTLLLSAGAAALAGCAAGGAAPSLPLTQPGQFVTRVGTQFRIGGRPYHYAGANMWYAAYLGAAAPVGDRARLVRELDMLAALGVDNLRILASSEASPLRGSITPSFRGRGDDYNQALLDGLDFALAEMGKRGMRAVLYLTNFWEWSGGIMTYLHWVNGGRFINMNDPAHPWPAFPDFAAAFYASEAVGLYHDYVRAVVNRTNSVTGARYRDDPTIMAWQLANEPRPGGTEPVIARTMPAFLAWIEGTAKLIKALDPNHLVSTGSEGLQGCNGSAECVIATHAFPEIDYLTAHIWPQNWGWADPKDLAGTFPTVAANTRDYIRRHAALATQLGKPLAIEEFGFPRDAGSFDPDASTDHKDRFYRIIFDAVEESAREGGPIAGSNFWAWGGEGRAAHPDFVFRPGDTSYMGDPPHEPQGWYSVLAGDESTKALVRRHAATLEALSG